MEQIEKEVQIKRKTKKSYLKVYTYSNNAVYIECKHGNHRNIVLYDEEIKELLEKLERRKKK